MPHSHVPDRRVILRPLAGTQAVGFPFPRPARPADDRAALGDWLDRWMDAEIEPYRAETTVNGYRNIIRNHMRPALGAVRLSQLTPELINGYYQWLSDEKGLSPNTVRKHHVLLHTALESACRRGVLSSNPARRATPPPPVSTEVAYYTPARLCRLLREVHGLPLELPVKLACHLGLRRSEVLGLRWRDVDLQAGLLSVRRVRTTVGCRVVEKPPKTPDSCRTLSIGALDGLLELLRGIQAVRLRDGVPCAPDDYLVLDRAGKPWHPNTMTAALTGFVSERNLPPITFHGLRHTFASMANSARVPMYQISRAMGHSSPNITQRIYTHLFDQTHGEVLAAVADTIVHATSA